MKILLIFFQLCKTFDIKLYPPLGIAIENRDNAIIVTNGYIKTNLRVEMQLPGIDTSVSEASCSAKTDGEFEKLIDAASTQFKNQIQIELDEFIDSQVNINQHHHIQQEENKQIEAENIKTNPLLCNNENIRCRYFPVVDLNPENSKEFVLRACYDSTLGEQAKRCEVAGATTICCSKRPSQNANGKCLSQGMDRIISMIARHELTDTSRKHQMGHGNIQQSRINNYCIAVLDVEINGTKTKVGTYTEVTGDAAKNLPLQTRKKRSSREKRSIWQYYAQGGFFTSDYIDNQISRVQDVMKANNLEMKQALEQNSKTLLTLQADQHERQRLQAAVCTTTDQLSKSLILTELREAHTQLEFKADAILRTCANGEVPDQVENTILTKICSSLSESKFCFGSSVRSLFRCKLDKPLISITVIGIVLSLTMHIPINEDYTAMKFHGIGVPFISEALSIKTNITDMDEEILEEKISDKEKEDTLDIVFRQFIEEMKQEIHREKRELVSVHHFLKIKSIPDIVIQFNGDYISFLESDFINTPWAKIVDYSQNIAQDNECVKSIMRVSLQGIKHYCQLELLSSNYPCMVKHIGDLGYLISTEGKIQITEMSDKLLSVFNNKESDECKNTVCVIPVGPTKKTFKCGSRQYYVGQHENMQIKIETPKIKPINLKELDRRKSEINDLIKTGFNMLDKIKVSDEILKKGSTVGTIASLTLTVILILMIAKIGIFKGIRFIIHKIMDNCRRYKRKREEYFSTSTKPQINNQNQRQRRTISNADHFDFDIK